MISYPWSAVAALIYVYALIVTYSLSRTHPRLRRLYSGKTCIITIALATVMIVLFGFTGFARTWYYYLVMLAMVTSMGLVLIDDLNHLKQRRIAMVLAHFSVTLVLVAGLFGSGDKQSTHITAYLDKPVSESVTDDGLVVQMPFMLTLKSFSIDRYAPRVSIDGDENSEGFELGGKGDTAIVGGWHLTAMEFYDMALPEGDGFKEIKHVGAEPAVLLRAHNPSSGQTSEGWVSCGSFVFDAVRMALPDGRHLYMESPVPKKYESEVSVIDAKGHEYNSVISVNHPARVGQWHIYQADYDTRMGRWSAVSVFLCVKDPWYPLIQAGLWLVLISGIIMVVTAAAGKKKKEL